MGQGYSDKRRGMSNFFKWLIRKDRHKSLSQPPNSPKSNTSSEGSIKTLPTKTPKRATNRLSDVEPEIVWPEKSIRWQKQYDVYICHSTEDSEYALQMLSYLESQSEKFRCFLPMRNMEYGSPMSSEMCRGLENSHCWIMLITQHFLDESWCNYQMHQALAESPVSDGRFFPVMRNLSRDKYPPELKFMYYIDGTSNNNDVFSKIKRFILSYLKKMQHVMTDDQQSGSSEKWERNSSSVQDMSSPMHPPSSITSERSSETQEASNTSERSCETQDVSNTSKRSCEAQEVSITSERSCETQEVSNTSERSCETQEVSNTSERSCEAQEVSNTSERSCETQEVSNTSERSCEIQEASNTSERSCKRQGARKKSERSCETQRADISSEIDYNMQWCSNASNTSCEHSTVKLQKQNCESQGFTIHFQK